MEADEHFEMRVDAITKGLGHDPRVFEPLRRLGVKAYSNAFQTRDEVLPLRMEREQPARAKQKSLAWRPERVAGG